MEDIMPCYIYESLIRAAAARRGISVRVHCRNYFSNCSCTIDEDK